MIRDALLCFSGVPTSTAPDPSVAVPTSGITTVMPQTIDTSPLGLPTGSGGGSSSLPNVGRDLGVGGEMWINVLCATALTGATATLNIELVTDSTQTISTLNVLMASGVFSNAQSLAFTTSGANSIVWRAQLPASLNYKQFIGLAMVVTTGFAGGALFAELIENIQQSDIYGSGFAIQ